MNSSWKLPVDAIITVTLMTELRWHSTRYLLSHLPCSSFCI